MFVVFGGVLTKHCVFVIRGVIVPPSKLIVTNIVSPKVVFFIRGG